MKLKTWQVTTLNRRRDFVHDQRKADAIDVRGGALIGLDANQRVLWAYERGYWAEVELRDER